MRRVLPVLAFLAWAAPANAAPTVAVQATPALGAAPLDVTLSAAGEAVAYHWELGDRTQAGGPVVQHRYGAGKFTATVTATGADGTTAQASITITSVKLTLSGPRVATYRKAVTLRGRVVPAVTGSPIALYSGTAAVKSAKASRSGRFRFRVRQTAASSYSARFEMVSSSTVAVAVRPRLDVSLPPNRMLGQRLVLHAKLRPRGSGKLRVRVWRSGRKLRTRRFGDRATMRLGTGRVADYVVLITVKPIGSYRGRRDTFRASVFVPYLAQGANGPSVRILERRLAQLRYALRGVDTSFSSDTADAVLAFQKVHGMARTGRVDPSFWRRLQAAHVPFPRYRGPYRHVEVDKTRQVLFQVVGGRVVRVVHVSTGATGNTPIGRWRIYSKVPGFLPTGMFYSSFFIGAFAIHGYPSVPPYPASHGCVRTPMWIAPTLFASNDYGETVYIYA
jgi:Putative peptidoglycan binding domain/L,D-transpeptidase catalytic domain/PKD domain